MVTVDSKPQADLDVLAAEISDLPDSCKSELIGIFQRTNPEYLVPLEQHLKFHREDMLAYVGILCALSDYDQISLKSMMNEFNAGDIYDLAEFVLEYEKFDIYNRIH